MTYGLQTAYEALYHKRTSHTSAQAGSSTSGGLITVLGSEADYIPASSASYVIYEINFYAERLNWVHNCAFILQHYQSGSWSAINTSDTRSSLISASTSQGFRGNMHFRWILPSWTGSKSLRLQMGTRDTNHELYLNALTQWDGSNSSSSFSDTTLIIYSS
tara:strand:+ start:1058 stop:1540 length:483 start_codon:yes stop_codon:yes gene_type:complete